MSAGVFSENCAWIDGQRVPLTAVELHVEPPGDAASPWRIRAGGLEATMRAVEHRARNACEYCHLPQDGSVLPHQIDHIIGTRPPE